MSEDYIRDELQKATAEYIRAVRLAVVRTKEARRVAGGGRPALPRYTQMNKIERFHEDRKISLEAFLHNLESCHSRGMIISIESWLDAQRFPSRIQLEELLGKELSEDERERIRRSFGVPDAGGEGGAGDAEAEERDGGAAGHPRGDENEPSRGGGTAPS